MDDEDNPPSYADAMAAIADGMRRQGIQTRDSFTPDEMSGRFSDVIVIFPSSRDSLSSGGSSFHVLDPSLTREPPPPYNEHPFPSVLSVDDPSPGPSLSESLTSPKGSIGQPSIPPRDPSGQQTRSHVFQDETNRITSLHRDNTFHDDHSNSGLAIGGSTLSDDFGRAIGGAEHLKKDESELDPSLPGRVVVEQSDFVISSSSPPSTDIKWSGPENAINFSGLMYVVAVHTSCRPNFSGRQPERLEDFEIEWLNVLDTSRPLLRVYHTPSSLMIGSAKWSLKDPMSLNNLKIRLRVRAVDGNGRLPSCNKGPWSEDIVVRYIDTSLIMESQEKAFKKTRIPSTSKDERLPKPDDDRLSSFDKMNQFSSHTLLGITLKNTEYHIGKDSSIQTNISWIMPANSGCFHKVWYEVQCINKAPLAYCLKGTGKIVEELCGRNAPASVGQLGAWITIAEVSSASLRVQRLSNFLSVGQYKWDVSNTDQSYCVELRIRPVAIRRNDVLTGPWSDVVKVYVNKEETKKLQ